MTRAIILAAGDCAKWENHLGTRPHFALIDGEPILLRTVAQLKARGVTDIWIVGPPDDERYLIEGTQLFVPTPDPANYIADQVLHNRSLWCDTERTITLWGDTYFTDATMDAIAGYTVRDWRLFARFGPSQLTGCPWGEVFAVSFWPEHAEGWERAVRHSVDLQRKGVTRRSGAWEGYRIAGGAADAQVGKHRDYGLATWIDDWTEDFDFPRDYDEFIRRRAAMATAA